MTRIYLGGFVRDPAVHTRDERLSIWITGYFQEQHDWLMENARGKWHIFAEERKTLEFLGLTGHVVYLVFYDDVDAVHYRMRW